MVHLDVHLRAVDGVKVTTAEQLTSEVAKYRGRNVQLLISNDQYENKNIIVLVRESPPAGEGSLGVAHGEIVPSMSRMHLIPPTPPYPTPHQWLVKRAMLPVLVASTMAASSVLNR